jgi:hypothetical protein
MTKKAAPPAPELPATRRHFGQDRDRFRSFDVRQDC